MNKTHDELCQEVAMLRTGIRQMSEALAGGAWADLLTTDTDLGALESQILGLIEGDQEKEAQIQTARSAVVKANEQGRRLAHRLQEASDMLTEALALGEDSAERYRALKESRPTEIADAVMRARREWAEQGRLRPTAVRRTSDMSVEVTFHSCRIASKYEALMQPVGGAA